MKVEVKVGVEHFFPTTFENFYVAIWSCMKLKEVLEVLPMLMLEKFLDQFVFIWGHEQCSKISNIIILRSFYYLRDLKHVFYACHNLMGKKIECYSLTMNPTRHLGIQIGLVFSSSPLKESCQKLKCNGWICHLVCGLF
jgi:hypothetical protein